ncbi:MAG: metallophosphoesterase family protein [Pseudomonadota bacterium]
MTLPPNPSIGVISDTHGLLRPEAADALEGSDLILHAGDIGSPEILPALKEIAPVLAIRGNVDTDSWARDLPEHLHLKIAGIDVEMIHDLQDWLAHGGPPQEATPQNRLVIAGHSHKPISEARDRFWHLNPGSAGRRRFRLPITLARLWFAEDGTFGTEIVPLL